MNRNLKKLMKSVIKKIRTYDWDYIKERDPWDDLVDDFRAFTNICDTEKVAQFDEDFCDGLFSQVFNCSYNLEYKRYNIAMEYMRIANNTADTMIKVCKM